MVHVFAQAIEQGARQENLAAFIKNQVEGQPKFLATHLNIAAQCEWDENGAIIPFGQQIIRVNENGEFYSTGERVDLTGLNLSSGIIL